jgi:hypothetical protein
MVTGLAVETLDGTTKHWDIYEPEPPNLHTFAFLLYSVLSKNIQELCKEAHTGTR